METAMVTAQIVSTVLIAWNVTPLRENYMKVKLYTMKGCTNCQLAKEHLIREGIAFEEVDCDKNMDEAVTAVKAAGSDFLPIICYNGDNYIAGYDVENIDKLINLCKR